MIVLDCTDGYLATVEIAHDGEGAILTICEEEEGHTPICRQTCFAQKQWEQFVAEVLAVDAERGGHGAMQAGYFSTRRVTVAATLGRGL